MTRRVLAIVGIVLVLAVIAAVAVFLNGTNIAVLNPMGTIATQERQLIIFGTLLSVIIVVPVFALTIGIAWHFRAGNTKASYRPEWSNSRVYEGIWWAVPAVLILILSVVTWTSSHQLDPARALTSSVPPLKVQVIALDWKWLFIYPELGIASVNYLQIPVGTPVEFQLTSDAPMNSFWIPQLGGQIYAMPGMSTQLHLMADQVGDFHGSSANISGVGYAGMQFTTRASSPADFHDWVDSVRQSTSQLTRSQYDQLAEPSVNAPLTTYSMSQVGLYDEVMTKYMVPGMTAHGMVSP